LRHRQRHLPIADRNVLRSDKLLEYGPVRAQCVVDATSQDSVAGDSEQVAGLFGIELEGELLVGERHVMWGFAFAVCFDGVDVFERKPCNQLKQVAVGVHGSCTGRRAAA